MKFTDKLKDAINNDDDYILKVGDIVIFEHETVPVDLWDGQSIKSIRMATEWNDKFGQIKEVIKA